MTGVEVRYGDGTMGEVRLVVSKAACFGAAARPRGGYDALPDTPTRDLPLLKTPEGAILASNEPEPANVGSIRKGAPDSALDNRQPP